MSTQRQKEQSPRAEGWGSGGERERERERKPGQRVERESAPFGSSFYVFFFPRGLPYANWA